MEHRIPFFRENGFFLQKIMLQLVKKYGIQLYKKIKIILLSVAKSSHRTSTNVPPASLIGFFLTFNENMKGL